MSLFEFIMTLNFNIYDMSSGELFLKAAYDGNAHKLTEMMTGDPAIKNYKDSNVC